MLSGTCQLIKPQAGPNDFGGCRGNFGTYAVNLKKKIYSCICKFYYKWTLKNSEATWRSFIPGCMCMESVLRQSGMLYSSYSSRFSILKWQQENKEIFSWYERSIQIFLILQLKYFSFNQQPTNHCWPSFSNPGDNKKW